MVDRARPISLTALKYVRNFQRNSFQQILVANITPKVMAEMEGVLRSYITHILERNLNTPRFVHQVSNEIKSQIDSLEDADD